MFQAGGGVVDENAGMVGRAKVPVYPECMAYNSEYAAAYSEVYGKKTSPIPRVTNKYLKMCKWPHTSLGAWNPL